MAEVVPRLIFFFCHRLRCAGSSPFSRSRAVCRAWTTDASSAASSSPSVAGLRWRDAPPAYGPHKTLYNRFIRWSRLGVFDRISAGLAGAAGEPDRLMIDSTHLKAHRTAASLLKKGLFPAASDAPRAG